MLNLIPKLHWGNQDCGEFCKTSQFLMPKVETCQSSRSSLIVNSRIGSLMPDALTAGFFEESRNHKVHSLGFQELLIT
jgi:hypothetical protein